MGNQIVVYPYYGILLGNKKKNEILLRETTWMNLRHYAKWKESDTKATCYIVIPTTWNSKKKRTIVTGSRSVIICGQGEGKRVYWKEAWKYFF